MRLSCTCTAIEGGAIDGGCSVRVLTVVTVVVCRQACGKSVSASFSRYALREILQSVRPF
jgi:hypothetical protein